MDSKMICTSCEKAKEEITMQVISKMMPLMLSLFAGTREDFERNVATLYEKANEEINNTEVTINPIIMSKHAVENRNLIEKDEMEALKLQVQETQEEIFLNKSKHNIINDRAAGLVDRVQELEVQIKESDENRDKDKENINKLNEQVKSLTLKNQILLEKSDAQQQYTRLEILELRNVPLRKGEGKSALNVALDFFKYRLGVTVHPNEISTCHRLRYKRKGDQPLDYHPQCPPIYVKFVHRDLKNHLLNLRYKLKWQQNFYGHNFDMAENLTPMRRNLLKDVKSKLSDWKFIWTKGGDIWARKEKFVKSVKINTYETLDYVLSKENTSYDK